jgi:hypothetical protein
LDKYNKKTNENHNISVDKIEKELPDGSILIAKQTNNPDFPGIQISLKQSDSDDVDETMCFVEFNKAKPTGEELNICAYIHDQDEPAYYANYKAFAENKK